jgi:hypothetical protein
VGIIGLFGKFYYDTYVVKERITKMAKMARMARIQYI